jgi:hypothetical protein
MMLCRKRFFRTFCRAGFQPAGSWGILPQARKASKSRLEAASTGRQDACPTWLSAYSLVLLLALTGCYTQKTAVGPVYHPSNVFRLGDTLPSSLRRVAVLPLTGEEGPDAHAGSQTLEPVLHTELLKTGKFELIVVSPDALRQWTGRKLWEAQDKLPADFFGKLHEQTGCDGVLFCRLSRFRAYPPLVIGWNLRLVETAKSETLWAIDDVFDAGEPTVLSAARHFQQQHQKSGPVIDSPFILNSPERFGHYTAWAVLGTLPAR